MKNTFEPQAPSKPAPRIDFTNPNGWIVLSMQSSKGVQHLPYVVNIHTTSGQCSCDCADFQMTRKVNARAAGVIPTVGNGHCCKHIIVSHELLIEKGRMAAPEPVKVPQRPAPIGARDGCTCSQMPFDYDDPFLDCPACLERKLAQPYSAYRETEQMSRARAGIVEVVKAPRVESDLCIELKRALAHIDLCETEAPQIFENSSRARVALCNALRLAGGVR